MKFAAFGRTKMLYDAVFACIQAGHELVFLGTARASPEYSVNELDFESLAKKYSVPFFCGTKLSVAEHADLIKLSRAEIAISMNWPTLVDTQLLNHFKFGIINAHPGDLPRFRGNACPNWAIIAGEDKVVVTLHQMTANLDAGDICLKRAMTLTPETYIGDVYEFLETNIPQMFVHVLDSFENGSMHPVPQSDNPAASLRVFPRLPIDSQIDWMKPAKELDRLVRASAEPFSGAYTFIGGRKLILWRAHATEEPYPYIGSPGQVAYINSKNGLVSVLCGQGTLVLEEIGFEFENRERASRVIRSARTRLGMDYAQEIRTLKDEITSLKKRLSDG